jgi:hypothetical protein
VTVPHRKITISAEEASQDRRSDFDVTNTIQVSSPRAVRQEVQTIYESLYTQASFDPVWLAFHDFERFFRGESPDYFPVDTSYHDMQHTLDMTLCTARLIAGYENSVESRDRLGSERASLAVVSSLFHDFGYLRHKIRDRNFINGAEFTRSHVSRSGQFLESYLPRIGLEQFVPMVSSIVHFTGYEIHPDKIEMDDPKDSIVGHLLGTGDLLAQISDRCYLEKCRDRLYPEFVLGGIAIEHKGDDARIRYLSGQDLLSKTITFFRESAHHRLEHTFNGAYRYLEAYFEGGVNPYVHFVRKNLLFLKKIIRHDEWRSLRRRPPCVVPDPYGEARVMAFAMKRLREISDREMASRHTRSAPH